jgi:ABC-type transport system involved in cytochrome c biogenesis permease subunit
MKKYNWRTVVNVLFILVGIIGALALIIRAISGSIPPWISLIGKGLLITTYVIVILMYILERIRKKDSS